MPGSATVDMTLACSLCGNGFVFSAGEQELQQLRGIRRVPERCPRCARQLPGHGGSQRTSGQASVL
jgi:hypothetical protein